MNALRWLSPDIGRDTYYLYCELEKLPVLTKRELPGVTVWISQSTHYMIKADLDLPVLARWISRCCHEGLLWDTACVLWAYNGSCVTNFRVANAILAVMLAPGGDNLAPLLIDQACDGEFK